MNKKMNKNDEALVEKMNAVPGLRAKIERIIQIARNERTECQTLDAAEIALRQEVNELGREVLEEWAEGIKKKSAKKLKNNQ